MFAIFEDLIGLCALVVGLAVGISQVLNLVNQYRGRKE